MRLKPTILFLTLILCLSFASTAYADMSMKMSSPAETANNMKGHNPCNPCNMKNPCAANNDAIDPKAISRPAGTELYSRISTKKLIRIGKKLFNDTSLSSIGLSCNSCHATDALFNKSFSTPYPHQVTMAQDRAGMKSVHADEFIQFCLLAPMKGETLGWESKKLAALTAYVTEVKQKKFIKKVLANPCHFKQKTAVNPCNPCNMKARNPCNPCGMKTHNPCNPCSM